jgi:hypothetical protein
MGGFVCATTYYFPPDKKPPTVPTRDGHKPYTYHPYEGGGGGYKQQTIVFTLTSSFLRPQHPPTPGRANTGRGLSPLFFLFWAAFPPYGVSNEMRHEKYLAAQ